MHRIPCNISEPEHVQDDLDSTSLFQLLETEVLPMYYNYPKRWLEMMKNGMYDIIPRFDSKRMAQEYYEKLYSTAQMPS